MREIHCQKCGVYIGTITKAKLMVGITYMCPKCSKPAVPETDFGNDFMNEIRNLSRKG